MNDGIKSDADQSARAFVDGVGRGDAVLNLWISQGIERVVAMGVLSSDSEQDEFDLDHRLELNPAELLMDKQARLLIAAIHAPTDARNCRVCVEDTSTNLVPVRWPCPTFQALVAPYVASGRV